METNLRPMSLGEILDRTAQLYRTHFLLFAGISAVYAGVLLVLNLIQIGISQLLKAMHLGAGQQLWVSLGFLAVILPAAILAAGAAVAANNRAVAWVNLGQPATIRSAYQSILKRIGSYLWLMFLIQAIIYAPFAIIYGGMVFYMWKAGAFNPAKMQHQDPQAAIMLLGGLSIFALLLTVWGVYAILMGLRYSLAVPASVVESLKARKAMQRSIELSKGSRGRIFMLGLLVLVIELILLVLPVVVLIVIVVKSHGALPVWAQIVWQLVVFLTNSFIGPIYATGLTLFYYDQRIRKEGFDIEWMMEAAGLSWPPPWAGIDAENAHSAPGALAVEPASAALAPDTLSVEVAVHKAEEAAKVEPTAKDPAEPTTPENDHDQQ
jgi:hypothetical protein